MSTIESQTTPSGSVPRSRITPNQISLVLGVLWLGITGVVVFVVPMRFAQEIWVKEIVQGVTDYVPAMRNIQNIPGFHEYTLFAHAVFWITTPIFFLLSTTMAIEMQRTFVAAQATTLSQAVSALLFFSVCLAIVWLWPIGGYVGWRDKTLVSPVGFFLYTGAGYASVMFVAGGMVAVWVKLVKKIFQKSHF